MRFLQINEKYLTQNYFVFENNNMHEGKFRKFQTIGPLKAVLDTLFPVDIITLLDILT